ncbi:MAG: DUF2007 domain-containing protein [Myxococcaceae bacterium]|nr:DUF2007 domain-containing protein [Myxococcaceae bacterium]
MSDGKTFTIVEAVDDPLTAERLEEVLREAKIDAFVRNRGSASSASFEPASPAYFELFVPQSQAKEAAALVAKELEAIEQEGEANAKAAEEEMLSGENPTPEG